MSEDLEGILKELKRRADRRFIDTLYPETGPLSRDKYKAQMKFFEAGTQYKQRLFLSPNRVGKTLSVGGYETTLHLTGEYPLWWQGKRFNSPIRAWVGGTTNLATRDILQTKLLGDFGRVGTGLIPGDLIREVVAKRGVPDAVELVRVKHASGKGNSVLTFKSYEQGREAWQGTEVEVVLLDEEAPMAIRSEALMRTMTVGGILMDTYTPLNGMTEVTESYLDGNDPAKWFITATLDDAPHLTEAMKTEYYNSIPIHERDARFRGIPTVGVGKIYPVDMESMLVDDHEIPRHWLKGYGLDVGWNRTAAIWGALNRDDDVLTLYSEHYQGAAEPAIHATAIKARSKLVGLIDPASRGRAQKDGEQLMQLYRNEGLILLPADNAVEAGIYDVWQRMTSGRLRIFKSLRNTQKELGLYHRDKDGKVVKREDHLMDALRYLVRGLSHLRPEQQDGRFNTVHGVRYLSALPRRRA
ncbi:MAG: terminase large subunit domain-containing protein [Acidobacteriaceae bacterium]